MIQRVNGSLAVSRALGDFDYKCVHGKGPTEQLVSPEPEVYAIERSEGEDEFIILACDGIWDVMANEELCDFVRSRLEVTDDLERVSNEIVDTCLYKVRHVVKTYTDSLLHTCLLWLIYMTSVFVLYFSSGKPGQYECCVNLLSWGPKSISRGSETGG